MMFLLGLAIGAGLVAFIANESAARAWQNGYEQAYRDGMKFKRITKKADE